MPRKPTKPDPQKQLMIKVKACQRLVKEAAYYEKELAENESKLAQMKDDGKDPYDVKKFGEVVAESRMMIPDSACRRDKALNELKEFVATLRGDEDGNQESMGCEWMVAATEILGDVDGGAEKDDGKESGGGDEVAVTSVDDLAEGEAF
ncbi:hypothetical protein ACHAWF_004014 [Thalassiosira exigua]